jgi:hypothetical protein
MPARHRRLTLLAVSLLAGIALLMHFDGSVTRGAFSASVANSTDQAGTGSMAFSNSYSSRTCSLVGATSASASCTGTSNPSATASSGTTTGPADSITNNGTFAASQLVEQAMAASCGPVQLANPPDPTNPLLPRHGVTSSPTTGPVSGAGSITLDGGSGYAVDMLSQTQPNPNSSPGKTYGIGIWFNTASSAGGSLSGIGTSPENNSGGSDRILYMTTAGTLGFVQNSSGTTTSTTAKYNDGNWHFAYVTMTATTASNSTTSIYVDGTLAATGGGSSAGYTADAGYWHAGWSVVSGSSAPHFWDASLSDFVVFDTSPAPADPTTAQLASQPAFNTWASSATESWPLNDTGTTTFAGPYPLIGSMSPCTMVNLSWGFTNPISCAVCPQSTTAACTSPPSESMASFATGTWQTVAAPGPGVTQTSTMIIDRGSSYNSYTQGLLLYMPVSLRMETTNGSWSLTFTWSSASVLMVG